MLSQTTQMTIDYMVYRAAIYARVSTDKQEEEGTSLVTQVQKCLECCWRKGYVVAEIHIYREVWTGAEYRERPLLSKLREAARNREFDVVVFYAFDRLSRKGDVTVDVAMRHNSAVGKRLPFGLVTGMEPIKQKHAVYALEIFRVTQN